MKQILTLLAVSMAASAACADFFVDDSHLIEGNGPRLSYGVAVTDLDGNNVPEFIVTGFGYPNIALEFTGTRLSDVMLGNLAGGLFSDAERKTIGVSACDVDGDGREEVYFLNTDSYSGEKLLADRLLDFDSGVTDLFEQGDNWVSLNLTAGRSVACVDREGDGTYGIYVSNYGGPSRFYEVSGGEIEDISTKLGIDRTTGGRAVVSGHILGSRNDMFAANEQGPSFLYQNFDGRFVDRAVEYGVDDARQNGRGTALADILYDGRLGIIIGNWNGYHRAYVPARHSFLDYATEAFREPSLVRTVISADFDNDGFDEIFFNNIGQPNRMFRVRDGGVLEPVALSAALEADGLGTGAAVADMDGDGVLDLLVAHGESAPQPLSLFRAAIDGPGRYLRIAPLTGQGAPARGATVILETDMRVHAKTIDAGSGYLCQMEPVAHYGLRDGETVKSVKVRWTDGTETGLGEMAENKTHIIRKDG